MTGFDRFFWWKYIQRALWVGLGLLLAWRLQQTVQLLLISLFFAGAIAPLVGWLERRRIGRGWAVALIYLVVLFALLLTLAPAPKLIVELGQFLKELPQLIQQIDLPQGSFLGIDLRRLYDLVQSPAIANQLQNLGTSIASGTVGFTVKLLNVVGIALLCMIVTGYMVVNAETLIPRVLAPCPPPLRAEIERLLPPISQCLGAYVLGRVGTSALLGFCTYLGLAFINVPFAGPLGLVVAVSNLIPFVGPFLGLIPMVIAAWPLGLTSVGIAVGLSFGLQQIEAWILQPFLVGPYLNLDPFELLLSIIVGAELLGVLGAVIAPPIAGIGRIVFDRMAERRRLARMEVTALPPGAEAAAESSDTSHKLPTDTPD